MKIEARYAQTSTIPKLEGTPLFKNPVNHRNLSYAYPGGSELTLKNITFKLEAGESLAIVGCNGSGK